MAENNIEILPIIKIFIGGSTGFKEKRTGIINELTKLNSKYDVKLTVDSFETLLDEQDNYDNHIKSEANIVIMVLDKATDYAENEDADYAESKDVNSADNRAAYTKRELEVTCDSYKSNNKPYPLFFIQKESKDFDEYQKIIHERLNQDKHLQTYDSDGDLYHKVYDQVDQILINRFNVNKRRIFRYKTLIGILIASACLLLAALSGNYLLAKKSKQQAQKLDCTLLLTGGGSAANYIKKKYLNNKDLEEITGAYYVRMPSTQSWTLLLEELVSPPNGLKKYDMVSLSAIQANDSVFNLIKEKKLHYQILSIYLGEDPLVVYINTDSIKNTKCFSEIKKRIEEQHSQNDSNYITPKELDQIIQESKTNSSIRVYCTSPSSGTTYYYQEALNTIRNSNKLDSNKLNNLINDKKIIQYTERSIKKKPEFINVILGSEHYYKDFASDDFTEFHLKSDKSSKPFSKPIYIYFPALEIGNDSLEIKKNIYNFLIDNLHLKDKPEIQKAFERGGFNSNKDYHFYNDNDSVLLELNRRNVIK